jgi:NAD(P)-dependent dehydrogenase (short-subunit alcohol dehydrogenase family)
MKRFEGRAALITGAASGFGLQTSRHAARDGAGLCAAVCAAD